VKELFYIWSKGTSRLSLSIVELELFFFLFKGGVFFSPSIQLSFG
jgi:hypothetical protein